MLIELVQAAGLHPKRTSSTEGGEFHSACPSCGGTDRFAIWPKTERYWCRQCKKSGDAIQFCRDFMDMSYRDACIKVGAQTKTFSSYRTSYSPIFSPQISNSTPKLWIEKANNFVDECHNNLTKDAEARAVLGKRGISIETINSFRLGWNPSDKFLSFSDWGLPTALNALGKEKRLWLPKGIVIPTFLKENVSKLKTRRTDWNEDDDLPKYVEISGSLKGPSVYGNENSEAIIIVESELDAILVVQEINELCCLVALGSAANKPDLNLDRLLKRIKVLLFALDFDEAGKQAYRFWKSSYPHINAWPVPIEKSPGDAHKVGVDLLDWVKSGIKYAQNEMSSKFF